MILTRQTLFTSSVGMNNARVQNKKNIYNRFGWLKGIASIYIKKKHGTALNMLFD